MELQKANDINDDIIYQTVARSGGWTYLAGDVCKLDFTTERISND